MRLILVIRLSLISILSFLVSCASVEGVPQSFQLNYLVEPTGQGDLRVQATMSAVSLIPNRVKLGQEDYFYVETLEGGKQLSRDDNPIRLFMQGSIYTAHVKDQDVLTLGMFHQGKRQQIARIRPLPVIRILSPTQSLISGNLQVRWNAMKAFDKARVKLNCQRKDQQGKELFASFSYPLKSIDIARGEATVSESQLRSVINVPGYSFESCHKSLQIWRIRHGIFIEGGSFIDKAEYKDFQQVNFEFK